MGHWTYVVLGGILAACAVVLATVVTFVERRKHRGK